MPDNTRPRLLRLLPLLLLGIAVIAVFWPITLGGRSVGGRDVVSESLPLMDFYGRALRQNRLPLWNEQIMFGSPIHAEGQLGVCYPIHLILYRCFQTQTAYRLNLVLHFVLSAWFSYLCARAFGLRVLPSLLTAVVFTGQGSFVVHLGQPWSYTTACWLPLAVMCLWRWLQGGNVRWLLALVAVLAVQLTAGHFQMAFYTHVTLILLGLAEIAFGSGSGRRARCATRLAVLPLVLVAAIIAAAIQLVPTTELLSEADFRGRDQAYLNSFGIGPLHLTNYLAPDLMRSNPLWEPVAWVPWRTAANEFLCYVGLLPIGLALFALGLLRDATVRVLALAWLITTLLSMSPHLPGLDRLSQVAGFGWFTASSRWNMVSGLLLALLAARALDKMELIDFRRWLLWYPLVVLGLLIISVWTIHASTSRSESFSRPPNNYLRVQLLGHYGRSQLNSKDLTPAREFPKLVRAELQQPVIGLGLLLACGLGLFAFPNLAAGKHLALLVVIWTAVDLVVVAYRHSPLEFETARFDEASPVLQKLKTLESKRVAGIPGKLAMLAGAVPLTNEGTPDMRAYWTKRDIGVHVVWDRSFPTVPRPTRWWDRGIRFQKRMTLFDADDLEFLRLTGLQRLVCGPDAGQPGADAELRKTGVISDPWLSKQVFGHSVAPNPKTAARRGVKLDRATFEPFWQWTLWETSDAKTSRAWTFAIRKPSQPGRDLRRTRLPPPARRRMSDDATPVRAIQDDGETVVISGNTNGQAVLVLSDLRYPGWRAELTSQGDRELEIEPASGHWRAVLLEHSGDFTVTFRYQPDSFRTGWRLTLGAAVFWLLCFVASFCFPGRPTS